jgi:hypothetical protein
VTISEEPFRIPAGLSYSLSGVMWTWNQCYNEYRRQISSIGGTTSEKADWVEPNGGESQLHEARGLLT